MSVVRAAVVWIYSSHVLWMICDVLCVSPPWPGTSPVSRCFPAAPTQASCAANPSKHVRWLDWLGFPALMIWKRSPLTSFCGLFHAHTDDGHGSSTRREAHWRARARGERRRDGVSARDAAARRSGPAAPPGWPHAPSASICCRAQKRQSPLRFLTNTKPTQVLRPTNFQVPNNRKIKYI